MDHVLDPPCTHEWRTSSYVHVDERGRILSRWPWPLRLASGIERDNKKPFLLRVRRDALLPPQSSINSMASPPAPVDLSLAATSLPRPTLHHRPPRRRREGRHSTNSSAQKRPLLGRLRPGRLPHRRAGALKLSSELRRVSLSCTCWVGVYTTRCQGDKGRAPTRSSAPLFARPILPRLSGQQACAPTAVPRQRVISHARVRRPTGRVHFIKTCRMRCRWPAS